MRSSLPTRCAGAPDRGRLADLRAAVPAPRHFMIRQWVGSALQLANPAAVWLRTIVGSTSWAQRWAKRLFAHALRVDLPDPRG
jgi:hypothetical protein